MAFKVRADIISLRSAITLTKNNKIAYKSTEEEKKFYQLISDELDYYTKTLFDKFNQILGGNTPGSNNLKDSIISESKPLAMSRVLTGTLVPIPNDLKSSRAGSEPNLQYV